ncbi:MAG TPA: Fe-S cluster assembly protein NifU [Planctomycetota bacterium]|nr:Fe-S cluster assembly protein NifU [Planctomycetota bacterium]HRR80022.1 Fe-S cluster assembly protein NifU [Planctomycetota bacterium]
MWDYTSKVMDHFRNPRNVGVIEDADGIGEVGSLACGDALKLTFKLGPDGRIADAKFQTFGCASAIASSSVLTEMIKGMTLDEAAKVTNQDIADVLGGLPEQKMHCSVMGREALEAAIEYYRSGGKKTAHVLEGRVVCTCFGVTETEIERVIRENNLHSVEEVTNYCKAGGGCGGCQDEIKAILARVHGEPVKLEAPEPPRPRLTMMRKIQLVQEVLEREVRPRLQEDGGDIELIDVDGNRVIVALRGHCAMCRAAEFTLDGFVGAKLREFVSPDLVVVEDKP